MNAHQRRKARRAAKRKSAREIVAAKILVARFRAAYPKIVDFFSEFRDRSQDRRTWPRTPRIRAKSALCKQEPLVSTP